MKNLGLFVFFAGILVVVLMSGCAQEARYTASANASNTNTTKASPTPSPTIDPAVQKDRDRQKSIEEQKKEWARMNDPRKVFMDDVKKTGVCKNREQYQELDDFYGNYPESKREFQKHSFKLVDVGVAEAEVKKKFATSARGYLADMMTVLKSGSAFESCGNGEGGLMLDDRLAIAREIEYIVTHPDLMETKLLSSEQLRGVYLTAAKLSIADIKAEKEVDEQLLGQIIEDFGFSAKDLGVTQEDLDTIIVE